jgi:Holliday junction resolvasome RuvABC endonuclease subunit
MAEMASIAGHAHTHMQALSKAGVPMMVLGVDLSLASTGIAAIGDTGNIFTDRIVPGNMKGHARLAHIINQLIGWLPSSSSSELAVIEGLSFGSFDRNGEQAGLSWMVRHALWKRHIPYALVSPSQRMIYAVGNGRADKDRVLAATIKRYPQADIGGNDEADALLLAAIGARHLGRPIESEPLPQTHLRALDKVAWPELDVKV